MARFVFILVFSSLFFWSQGTLASGAQSRVFSYIVKSLNEEINGKLDAEILEFSPPSTVTFKDVTISSLSGNRLFSAKKVRAKVRVSDLFSSQINFDEIEIVAPQFNLQLEGGKLNLLSLFKSGESGSAPLQIGKLIIRDGQALFRDSQGILNLQHINIETDSFDSDFNSLDIKKLKGNIVLEGKQFSLSFDGSLACRRNKNNDLQLSYNGKINSLHALSTKIAEATLSSTVVIGFETIHLQNFAFKSEQLSFIAKGKYGTHTENLSITLNGRIPHTLPFVQELDAKWDVQDATVRASLNGNVNHPLIIADIAGKWRDATLRGSVQFDTASEKLTSELNIDSDDNFDLEPIISKDLTLSAPHIQAFGTGTLRRLDVALSMKSKEVRATSEGVKLFDTTAHAKGPFDTRSKVFSGEVRLDSHSATVGNITFIGPRIVTTLTGSPEKLLADGEIQGASLKAMGFATGKFTSKFSFGNDELRLSDLFLSVQDGRIKLETLIAQLSSKKLSGQGVVEHVALADGFNDLNALVTIGGTLSDPQIFADGKVSDVNLFGPSLGALDFVATFGKAAKGILQVSAGIDSSEGRVSLQSAIDTRSSKINAFVEFINLTSSPLLAKLDPWLKFGPSVVSGELEVTGTTINPHAVLFFSLNAERPDAKMNLLGLNATLELKEHKLSLDASANLFRRQEEYEPAYPAVPIKIKGNGLFKAFNDFSLNYDVSLESNGFEQVSDFLKKESISLDMKLDAKGAVEKKPNQDLKYSISANINELNALLPNNLPLKIEEPFVFSASNNTFAIRPKAHFLLNNGDFTIKGEFSSQKLNAEFDGRIPLYFARFFNRNIVDTTGVATGNVTVSGSFEKPLIKGVLKPEKDSSIKLRSLTSRIEFESGELRASVVNEGNMGLVRVAVDELSTKVGNGRLLAAGTLDLSSSGLPVATDLTLIGTDLSFTQKDIAVEGSFNLRAVTEKNAQWVRGVAQIVSGRFLKEFILDGFEINAAPAIVRESSLSDFLKQVRLTIDLDLSPFDLQADFGPFDFNGSIAGNGLHVGGNLSEPRIFGEITLTDGVFKFPAADFDIPTTPITLRNTPGKLIDPNIHIKATSELGKDFGFKDNTSVELSLDGNFDHFNLGLTPTSGEGQLDRQKILGILLNLNMGPEIFLRPLFGQVEQLLKTQTRTRLRIGSTTSEEGIKTKLDWRLNPRLEIGGSWSTGQLGLEDVHFKLNLFDHLPIGKELYLEGIFGFLADDNRAQHLQLNYRLFEK